MQTAYKDANPYHCLFPLYFCPSPLNNKPHQDSLFSLFSESRKGIVNRDFVPHFHNFHLASIVFWDNNTSQNQLLQKTSC